MVKVSFRYFLLPIMSNIRYIYEIISPIKERLVNLKYSLQANQLIIKHEKTS